MARSAAFIAVAVLLCIVLSTTASVLQCTGERHRDGQFYFNMSYDFQEDVNDCETQWVINGKVAGIFNADGNTEFIPPLVMATANTAIIETCHEKLECLLICPSASINKKQQCFCDMTSPTTLPEVFITHSGEYTKMNEDLAGLERHEVGFPGWIVGAVIGVSVFVILLVCVIVAIVLYKKKSRSRYDPGLAKETV